MIPVQKTFEPFRSLPDNITLPQQKLLNFCHHWHISSLGLFGSVLRPDFNPETSDIDILVDFHTAARHNLLDFAEMQEQLTHIFGLRVDLVSKKGLERSRNLERRNTILSSAQTIYDARSTKPHGHADLSSTCHELHRQ